MLACLLLLSGCVGLPSTSSVATGKAVDTASDDEPLVVEPLSASAFDDPRQIATGFLKAQMSAHDGHQVARTFLTAAAQNTWKPGSAVTVFSAETDMIATRPDTDQVRVSVPVVATISSDGHLQRAAQPTRRTIDFTVKETPSGWRLAGIPRELGLWVSDDDVSRLYIRRSIYYPAAVGQNLVADPRWLPRQGLATALARAALSEPPSWLAPAASRPFPDGTALSVDAVPVADGVAQVDLTTPAGKADNAQRAAMWASMIATLEQAPEVRTLNLTVGSSRLETENLPNVVSSPDDVGYDAPTSAVPAVISRAGTYLAWTSPDASDAASGQDAGIAAGRPKLPTVPPQWTLLAAGQGGRQIAALSQDRTSVRRWLNGTDITVPDVGHDLLRPMFDARGWLWTAGEADASDGDEAPAGDATGRVWVIDTAATGTRAQATALDVSWLGAQHVESLSLSPEGQRVALVLAQGEERRVVVAAVVRDAHGRPVSLGAPHDVAAGATDVRDVAWADPTSLALVGTIDGRRQIGLSVLDEGVQALGAVKGASGVLTTLAGENGLFVRAENATVYTRLGASWNSFLSGGDVIVPTP